MMKKVLFLVNDFSHDLFTGLWLCSFFLLYRLHSFSHNTITEQLGQEMFTLQSLSLFAICVTGGIRALHLRGNQENRKDPLRKKVLIIKHIVMGVLFVAGTFLGVIWIL